MEITIPIEDPSSRVALYGAADRNLRLIRSAFDVRVTARDSVVRISGSRDAVRKAASVLEELQKCLHQNAHIDADYLDRLIQRVDIGERKSADDCVLDVFSESVVITPKGEGQRRYVESILSCDLTFCLGPAGTGKTYLAVAASVALLRKHRIKRIVLARPAVEAGEKLGYLPGDLQAKVNPYLRPVFDAMHDMMSFDQLKRFMQNDIVEVVPLAFMRGRTLNHSAIVLDEAQNATPAQMLMCLTRLGNDSKMIVTGDDSQSDLASGELSGLIDAKNRLEGIKGISVVRLTQMDIVRHPLVQTVVEAYRRKESDVQ